MVEKLRQLKKESHMTNQQIAEKSNIPESTVARIFSGKTPNPTVTTVVSMARAMGSSASDLLDETDGIRTEECQEHYTKAEKSDNSSEKTAGRENANSQYPFDNNYTDDRNFSGYGSGGRNFQHRENFSDEKFYEDMLSLYKDEIRKKDVWLARLFWCLAGVVAFILFVLIFDILHPSFGFVKY